MQHKTHVSYEAVWKAIEVGGTHSGNVLAVRDRRYKAESLAHDAKEVPDFLETDRSVAVSGSVINRKWRSVLALFQLKLTDEGSLRQPRRPGLLRG